LIRALRNLFSRSRSAEFQFTCSECGERHSGAPSFSERYPTYFFDVPENERGSRIKFDSDLCVIQPEHGSDDEPIYCIRTILEIPILDSDSVFTWGVWVSQSKDSFEQYVTSYETDQSEYVSFGWLAVTMAPYCRPEQSEALEHLECDVSWGGIDQRPKIQLLENDHPLFFDQKDGITKQRAAEIAQVVMHPKS